MILYFSSTGNSKLLAENLALFTNDTAYNLVDITTTHTEKLLSHTPRLGFVFPTYGWDMPVIVSSFFKKIKDLHVNSNFIYVVVTCGDDVGFIDRKINKLFRNSNIKIDAFFSICMPNTYVCLPGFDVDNDKVRRKKLCWKSIRILLRLKSCRPAARCWWTSTAMAACPAPPSCPTSMASPRFTATS